MTKTFLHWGNIGDTWAAIPAMKEYCSNTGNKIILYLKKDHPAEYYEGATHPTKNKEGEMVCLNQGMIDMMVPLLRAQPFIEDAMAWNDEKIDVDMNVIRKTNVGMPALSINRWYFYTFPDLSCDLSKRWLELPFDTKDYAVGKILINRTDRYTNQEADYAFLKPYEDDCMFIGTMREYNNFCMQFDLNIRKLNVANFLEYAQAIDQSKFYMSNQSQGYQICQGLFHPSILETCIFAPNVIPVGDRMFDFINQRGLEYCFHRLNGSLEAYIKEIKKTANRAV
jgi:hypothetical protein